MSRNGMNQGDESSFLSGRRDWLRTAGALAAGAAAPQWLRDGTAFAEEKPGGSESKMIVRCLRPLDLESPVEVFDSFLTPNDMFFVRSHFGAPAVELTTWRLAVRGLIERPLSLSLDDLKELPQATLPAVLQCSGNGRSNYAPTVPGIGWGKGAVGNAEWGGVRLVDVLKRAGLKLDEGHVHMLGGDAPPSAKTPVFLRSLPLTQALHPSTLIATRMNGEPLPVQHGGPLRVVVPGWAGHNWIKWLRTITVAKEEAPGTYQQSGYRMPKVPAPPGADLKPSDLVPVTTMPVKSLIARPSAGARLKAGRVEVRGVAWTGTGHVTAVHVSTGPNAPWQPATLLDDERPGTWRRWRWMLDSARPGRLQVRVRATDSNGQTQPETTPWNRSGYLWNGIDSIECEII